MKNICVNFIGLTIGFLLGICTSLPEPQSQSKAKPTKTVEATGQSELPVESLSHMAELVANDIYLHDGAKSPASWDYVGTRRRFRFIAQEDGRSDGKSICYEHTIPNPGGGIAMTFYMVIELRPPIRVKRGDVVEIDCVVHSIDTISRETSKGHLIAKGKVVKE